jgi:virginiamycin B lyase
VVSLIRVVRRQCLVLVLIACGLALLSGSAYASYTATEYSDGFALHSNPVEITEGPNGNIWYAERGLSGSGGGIGEITPAGVVTTFTQGILSAGVTGITAGPDGNVWFTSLADNKVGKITPGGVVTTYQLPTANSGPEGIATGPNGNLWFTENSRDYIGEVTPTGQFTEFAIPPPTSGQIAPSEITAGPGQSLWFTEEDQNQIGVITTSGSVSEHPGIAEGSSFEFGAMDLTDGPDGDLWFTEPVAMIGQMTASGSLTPFSLGDGADYIAAGSDGALWYTEPDAHAVGRITTNGVVTDQVTAGIPSDGAPTGITSGPGGTIWFTDDHSDGSGWIGEITVGTSSCPTGDTGTPPNCVAPPAQCPTGDTGTPPNCVAPPAQCPTGDTGTPPNCVAPVGTCPTGDTGTPPNCKSIAPTCPYQETGTPPDCSTPPYCTTETTDLPGCPTPAGTISQVEPTDGQVYAGYACAGVPCSGTAQVIVVSSVGGHTASVRAAPKKPKPMIVATAHFSIKAHKSKRIRLVFSKAFRKLLEAKHVVKLELVITLHGSKKVERTTFTVRYKPG